MNLSPWFPTEKSGLPFMVGNETPSLEEFKYLEVVFMSEGGGREREINGWIRATAVMQVLYHSEGKALRFTS